MAIIYSYPQKSAALTDNVLISDSTSNSPKQQTKQASVSSIKDAIDVVDSLNSLTGDLNITGGTNIDVTAVGKNIEISTSASNVDGSGTAGTIPKWSDSNTLTDSIIKDQGGVDVLIPRFIKHDGDTDNLFGFNDVGKFLVSVDVTAEDQFSVSSNSIVMKTHSGTKVAAGPTGVTLYSDTSATAITTSHRRLATSTNGVIIYGQSVSEGASSEIGGTIRYYSNASNRYVGISGPVTQGTNYTLRLPDSVGTASQVLKLNSPIISGSTQDLVWGDESGGVPGGSTGSVQFKSSTSQFTGGDTFIFTATNDTLTIGETSNDRAGTIEIQSDENGATLKIGGGSQTYYTSIKGSDVDTASYNIILPPAGPGGNNKILESTSAGVLSWIPTPSSGTSLIAGSGIQIGSGTIQTDNLANGGIIYSGASSELAVDLSASAIEGTLAPVDGGTGLSISTTSTYSALMGNGTASFAESKNIESGLKLPEGETSTRPAAAQATAGLIRYNSETANFEVCKQTTASSGVYSWYTISGLTIIED